MFRAGLWTLAIVLYLRFGLEPTGWAFYEASHALGLDWLYWGYTVFRGGAYALGLWDYGTLACVIAGCCAGGVIYWRSARKARR